MEDLNITLYSQNTNGLRDYVKRKAVFNKLYKQQAGIILLQETH